jgi:preprotein translocase subunit YajC
MIALTMIAAAQTQQTNLIGALLPFLLIGGLMYFMLIRPQKRRVAEQKALVDSLSVGDEVLTIGGIFGTVRAIDDELDEVTLEVAPGTTLRILRSAVARRVVEEDEEEAWGEDSSEGSGEEA